MKGIFFPVLIFNLIVQIGISFSQTAFIPNSKDKPEVIKNIYEKGKQDALDDIAKSKYIIKWYGLPSMEFWEDLQAELLYENKGIITEFVAGDVLEAHEAAYWNGYNSISIKEIKIRFGQNILDSTKTVAKQKIKNEKQRKYRIPKVEDDDPFRIIDNSENIILPDSLGGKSSYGQIS